MTITTQRLILRRWRDEDRQPFADLNTDRRVMEFFQAPLTRPESDAFIDRMEKHFDQHGFGFCAAELRDGGAFAGLIGLAVPSFEAPFTPCVEIGWRLSVDFWGQGLATEGARAMVRYAFAELALDEIVAYTVPANVRSRRVMEKLGMTRNPEDDFDHPRIPKGHPLRRHVLYRSRH